MSSEPSVETSGLAALFREVVRHPVAVSMIFVAALVFGNVSYSSLPIELMPDISYPTVTVRTVFDGAAPQEVETQVSRLVEENLATLDGLVSIESRSRAGGSDVLLGFDWGTDMNASVQTIRENLQTTWFPEGADRPLILRYDPSLDPFLRVALSLDPDNPPEDSVVALSLLREIADEEIKRELEAMQGVAAVRVRGGLERELRVEVREDWLAAREITLDQVTSALRSENVNVAGGSIIEGDVEYLVRTLNQLHTVEEIESLKIRRSDGTLVALSTVATVHEGHRDREVVSHLDGMEAVELEVFKEADANVVDVAKRVKDRLLGDPAMQALPKELREQMGLQEPLASTLPDSVRLALLDDQAAFIEEAINNLRDAAVLGGLFAVLVLFLFLRDYRATGIIGLAIPVSVIIGFAPLYLQEVSLNLMSLGGLALGVGMLVDNAVVVLESIQRFLEEGESREDAAVHGAASVSAAVVASTLTTVAVFFPIAFVEGVAGELFGDLSIAVVSSLLASLMVALFLVPTLAALEVPDVAAWRPGGVLGVLDEGLSMLWPGAERQPGWFARLRTALREAIWDEPMLGLRELREYMAGSLVRKLLWPYALLRVVLQVPLWTAWTFFIVWTGFCARLGLGVGRLLLVVPAFLLSLAANVFQRIYEPTERLYGGVLAGALRVPSLVLLGALGLFVVAVLGLGSLGTALLPELHQGRFTIEAALPVGTPLETTLQVAERLERQARAHPDVATVYSKIGADRRADSAADEGEHTARIRVNLTPGGDLAEREARVMEELRLALQAPRLHLAFEPPSLFSFRTPVEVVLYGWDLDKLREGGDTVVAALQRVPGLRDVQTSLADGNPEVQIIYDREQLRRFNLDPATVADRVRDKVQGVEATRIARGDRKIDLKLQLVEADRATLQDLRRINVNPALVPEIPLDAVAEIREAEGPSEIRRVDQQRAVVVSANVAGFDLGGSQVLIEDAMRGVRLPRDVTWTFAGQSEEMQNSLASLQFALLLAVFLVYVIMASTFEHLLHPFTILFSVPLALVGVVMGLGLAGLPVSVVVLIGVIVLAGVVVNNAIVLVDTINRMRVDGTPRIEAIRVAGALRLRPILITTATTVLGLLPLSLGLGAGAELQQPLAIAVIGGLASSTLLTLVVIPVVYGAMTGGFREDSPPEPVDEPQGTSASSEVLA